MGDVPFVLKFALAALMLLPMAACARPVGDLGRAEASVLHDEAMPWLGQMRARSSKEPVSSFNQSDQEVEMHDRVWRYLVAPNASDWFFDIAIEMRRTRIAAAPNPSKFKPDRYYAWLKSEKFASSRTRYSRVSEDVAADISTMPETFRAICAAREIDRQRGIAVEQVAGLAAGAQQDVATRTAENDISVKWFIWSVRFRYDAYSLALDHLLVETPHEEALRLDGLLSDLSVYVGAAEASDFCSDPLARGKSGKAATLRPRVLHTDKEAALPPK